MTDSVIHQGITFTNGLVRGSKLEGYCTVTFTKTVFVQQVEIELCTAIYTGTNPMNIANGSNLPDDDPNERSWISIKRIANNKRSIICDTPHYSQINRITAFPPGTYRFAFRTTTDENFQLTSMLGNGVGIATEATPIIVTAKGKQIAGKNYQVPIIYGNSQINTESNEPVLTKKVSDDYIIDIGCDVPEAYQGDHINGRFSVTNRSKKSIEKIHILFCTVAIDSSASSLSRKINSSTSIYNIPVGTSTFTFRLDVPMTTPSDQVASPLRIVNCIIVEFKTGKVITKTHRTALPLSISARPANSRNAEEYLTAMSIPPFKTIAYEEVPYGLPPLYNVVCPKGKEVVYTSDNKTFKLNHKEKDDKFLDFQSTCFSNDFSVAQFLNIPYFLDHQCCSTSWEDPRPLDQRLPQHTLNQCNGFLSISVEETRGIPSKTKFAVCGLSKKNSFIDKVEIPLDAEQNNVVLTLKSNKKYIGFVDIDLTLQPFSKCISSWYFLREVNGSEFGFTGGIRLAITYSSTPHSAAKVLDYPAYISAMHCPIYPATTKMCEAIDGMNKILDKSNQLPFIRHEDKKIRIDFPHYEEVVDVQLKAKQQPIPVLLGNSPYIKSKDVVEVDIARKRRPSGLNKPYSQAASPSQASPTIGTSPAYSPSFGKPTVNITPQNTVEIKGTPEAEPRQKLSVSIVQERQTKETKIPTMATIKEPKTKRRLSLNSLTGRKQPHYDVLE
ncbi:Arrestin (Or s-antigen) [Entamoeba marina]